MERGKGTGRQGEGATGIEPGTAFKRGRQRHQTPRKDHFILLWLAPLLCPHASQRAGGNDNGDSFGEVADGDYFDHARAGILLEHRVVFKGKTWHKHDLGRATLAVPSLPAAEAQHSALGSLRHGVGVRDAGRDGPSECLRS